jgi:hypothetical protein
MVMTLPRIKAIATNKFLWAIGIMQQLGAGVLMYRGSRPGYYTNIVREDPEVPSLYHVVDFLWSNFLSS